MTTFTLIWQPAAVPGLIRIRTTDPQTAKVVRTAVNALAEDAYPSSSTPLGDAGLRRLRLGDVRVVYEVDDSDRAIQVLVIGRVGR